MKKVILIIITIIVIIAAYIIFMSYQNKEILPERITLSSNNLTLNIGETKELTITLFPENITNSEVTWTSSDSNIVFVDVYGKITGLKDGYATITVTTSNNIKESCFVTVLKPIIPVENIILDKEEISIYVNELAQITATVLPNDATDKSILWSSSDEEIANVNSNGLITGIKPGIVNIFASDKNELIKKAIKVTVKERMSDIVFDINDNSLSLNIGDKYLINASTVPKGGVITWKSKDENIVSVNNGQLTAKNLGSTKIIAECEDIKKEITVNVYDTYDIALFWGQSNMVGTAGKMSGELTKDNSSLLSGIDSDIIKNNKSYSKVNVEMPKGVAFEYKALSNSLVDISTNPSKFGEKIYYSNGTFSSKASSGIIFGQESYGTNMIPYFAKEYYEKTKHKLVIVFVAHGGMKISQFSPTAGNGLYNTMVLKYQMAERYIQNLNEFNQISNRFYVVYQGESDCISGLVDKYEKSYLNVHNNLKKDLKLSFGAMVKMTRGDLDVNNNYVKAIRKAQQSLADQYSDIIIGTDFPHSELLKNNRSILCPGSNRIHINAAGLNQIGRNIARTIYEKNLIKK